MINRRLQGGDATAPPVVDQDSAVLTTTTAATITLTCPRRVLAVLTLGGEVDLTALERLCAVMAAASKRPEVVVETAAVGFIDCAGLRPLVTAARLAAARGRLVLRDPSPAVVALIAWCGLKAELATSSARSRRRRANLSGQLVGPAAGAARP